MAASIEYISVACNQTPQSLQWGENDLICYGACNALVIYDPKAHGGAGSIKQVLIGHKARVNCVRWVAPLSIGQNYDIISGSVDKTVIYWNRPDIQACHRISEVLEGHESSVTSINYLRGAGECSLIASASVDNSIRIWERVLTNGTFSCRENISLGSGFALDLKFAFLPGTKVVMLAVAGDDSKVHLYLQNEDKRFCHSMSLSGHEDWVRGIDFTYDVLVKEDLLLVSCSQDSYIRMWRISQSQNCPSDELAVKKNILTVLSGGLELKCEVGLESVLAGHENWVYSVTTHNDKNKLKILSASMDKSVIVWECEKESHLWLEKARMGEVGGNTLGFYGAVFGPDGHSVLTHGFHGALHLWLYKEENDIWEPGVTVGGHFDEVQDIAWDPDGDYLLSCSSDQTTRLHAPWVQDSGEVSWHEIGRPQVHGYDMTCLTVLGKFSFASGADEKIVRTFTAPKNFIENLERISKLKLSHIPNLQLPEGASVPALGLSNKAVFEKDLEEVDPEERHPKDQYPKSYFVPLAISRPPTEETLIQNTLWPEMQKLYGHGYEIFALASNRSGTILASACKATTLEHAAIMLWDISSWKQICGLPSHTLTITQMAFSPNDRYLLSVSRDRTWTIFEKSEEEGILPYLRIAYSDKKTGIHGRIIWTCSWSHDSLYFATASRDKKVVVWGRTGIFDEYSCLGEFSSCSVPPLQLDNAVTAIDFAPVTTNTCRYLMAVGLENGSIELYTWRDDKTQPSWQHYLSLGNPHHLTVKRLKFSPKVEGTTLRLASCGSDHFVFIHSVRLNADLV